MIPGIAHVHDPVEGIYVGRPSIWGNPFYVGRDGTREEVVAKYDAWLDTQPRLLASLSDLRGKVLKCWCRGGQRCHAEVLYRRANEPVKEDL